MLPQAGATADLVADPRSNQLLLRGPDGVQQIARQLIQSIDRPPTHPSAQKAVVRGYPCPAARLTEIVDRLRSQWANRSDVRVSADRDNGRLLVLAPAEVHAAIPRQLAALNAGVPEDRSAFKPEAGGKTSGQVVELVYSQVDPVESMLRELLGPRLRPRQTPDLSRCSYRYIDSVGQSAELIVDRRGKKLIVFGAESLASQLVQLIHTLDGLQRRDGKSVRVVPLRKADPAKVRQAYEAYQSGYRRGSRARLWPGGADRPADKSPGSRPADRRQTGQSWHFPHAGVDLVSYMFQPPGDVGGGAPDAGAGAEAAPPTDAEAAEPGLELMDFGADVEIEALPDLDVIILRGRERDVEELSRIIEEIERLSAEAEPTIEIYPLKHVDGERLFQIVSQINQELIGGRQGRVSVTPLVKPNALLLIGWGEAVEAVKELIRKLDRPVSPKTQLRVFGLRHAAAMDVRTTVMEFLSGRGGLGPEVQITADLRTNSLVVQAAPRDMQEVEALIHRLDTDQTPATARLHMFKLKYTLATDLANTLQSAIDAARGGARGQKSTALELLTVDAEGERIVKSGILSDVEVTADPHTNTLVVSAPPDSVELIKALIEQLDTPAAVAQIKVFRILNSDANALVLMLRSLLPTSTGGAARPQLAGAEGETTLVPVRFAVETRTNTIIATGSAGDLAIIEALLLRLDAEEPAQRINKVYKLRNAPALDVAAAINEFLRSERQVQQAAPGTVSPFQQIESEVVVVPEPVSNALIISATPRFIEDIEGLVKELDAEPPQVVIQVLIAEVGLNDLDEFGVEFGLQDSLLFDRSTVENNLLVPGFNFNNQPLGDADTPESLATSKYVAGQALSHFTVGRSNGDLGYGGLVLSASSESISVLIRALRESRRLDVISRPQVMTLDNQPAFIQVGKRVPRITGSTISTRGQINNITLENVGLILGVTPRINPVDGMVVMEIDAEKSELDPTEGIPISFSARGDVIRSPVINLAMAQTTVSAADGDTVVLGGMISKNTAVTQRRVPYLSDIPVLGKLFQFESESLKRSELLIILTPHVVRSPEEADRIKRIEAARIDWCLADVRQIHGPVGVREESAVIYPATNPRGVVPEESAPEEAPSTDLEFSTPLELIPGPSGPTSDINSDAPNLPDRRPPGVAPGESTPAAPYDWPQGSTRQR